MPTISAFYGIVVLMFYRDNRQHHRAHIHVRYQGEESVLAIDPGLESPEHRALRQVLEARWAGRLSLSRVG